MKYFSIIFVFLIVVSFSISSAQINWEKYEGNPVLTHGGVGSWDSLYIQHSSVVFDGTKYHMYYTGSSAVTIFSSIGHATSDDGILWAKDILNNPVIKEGPTGSWDRELVGISSVLYDNSVFHMWYTGGIETSDLYRIGYATSMDGSTWTKYDDPATTSPLYTESDPVLMPTSGAWDSYGVEAPTVIREGNSYIMWYNGYTHSFGAHIGRATSEDGITWNKDVANNPVLNPGSATTWENNFIRQGSVVFDQENSVYLFFYYAGEFYKQFQIGYAWSHDGVNWTKYNNPATSNLPYTQSDPILSLGSAGSWDDHQVMSPWVILQADTLKMWYAGSDTTYPPVSVISAIGYATIPLDTLVVVGIDKYVNRNFPRGYSLSQNYPNPFNPTTTISYQLPAINSVDLSIFNVLGQKVATLVSTKQSAGAYNVEWEANSYASGIYYYQLVAGDYKEVKKMILLK